MCKYSTCKGAPNSNYNVKFHAFKGAPTAIVMFKYLAFKEAPTATLMNFMKMPQMNKSSLFMSLS